MAPVLHGDVTYTTTQKVFTSELLGEFLSVQVVRYIYTVNSGTQRQEIKECACVRPSTLLVPAESQAKVLPPDLLLPVSLHVSHTPSETEGPSGGFCVTSHGGAYEGFTPGSPGGHTDDGAREASPLEGVLGVPRPRIAPLLLEYVVNKTLKGVSTP